MNIHSFLKNLLYSEPSLGEVGALAIRHELEKPHGSMVARFGSVEIKGVLYPKIPWPLRSFLRDRIFTTMRTNAGFFSNSEIDVRRFSELMLQDMQQLDVLGSWRVEEQFLASHFPSAARVDLKCIEPYLSANPWSQLLEGRKVLVIHPFNHTIERQYHEKRELLFVDKRVLPKFESFQTLKSVQTVAGNTDGFTNWFDALDSMKKAISAKDFDIAILGCGAYGFPLAAHIKRMGKKAIHMGGPTQILFGIKGQRWDNHPVTSKFYNEHWVRPTTEDIPVGANKVENGCYW